MSGGGGKIEQRVVLTRQEAARWLHQLATALENGGTADVALVGPTVALNLPEEFEVELELEPYGEKIELEFELVWPNDRGEPSSDRPRTSVAAPTPLR
ncbi:amphi-Trp domain-containing protein [Actinomycetospora lemnae]|uniref:Amphi-Trp domain-containing protein n=1 Tax=Actinomycetospora lemnae TaxID=3019891 RepID=A0ABT5SQD6_9PSEU|nr:amphi-Trp domain-containing protein [Actinomycetospora sp. DW7H6]MDD7964247.1 amphi-Trp domain-containing protein [Actinomycetospora sp. DW7H6]